MIPSASGASTLFLYTKGTEGVPNEALRQLLRYMEETTYENAVNEELRELHRMVEQVKKDQEVSGMRIQIVEDVIRLSEENAKLTEEYTKIAKEKSKISEENAKLTEEIIKLREELEQKMPGKRRLEMTKMPGRRSKTVALVKQ